MGGSYLGELLKTAVRIMELDELESRLDKHDWKVAKEEYDEAVAAFNKQRSDYVDALLSHEVGQEAAVSDVEGQLSNFRETADPSWYPAITYTEENLLPYLRKQAGMNPSLREAIKLFPYAAGAIVIVAYFTVRLMSATPVTESIETKEGLLQRADAVEKALRYDDWMDTRVRRGGFLKGLLLWPIEPTDGEIEGAAEFVGLVMEGQQYAQGCGVVTGYGETLSNDQIKMVGDVIDYLQRPTIRWLDPPIRTVIPALESASVC